jgi:hypothetical protein
MYGFFQTTFYFGYMALFSGVNLIKTFYFVTDDEAKYARAVVLGKPFLPGPNVINLFTAVIYECL